MQKTFVVIGQRVEKDSLKRICLEIDFLLSSEDTAVGLSLIRQCANLLIVGAVAFSTYAKSYNRLFGYHGNLEVTGSLVTEDSRHSCRIKRKMR